MVKVLKFPMTRETFTRLCEARRNRFIEIIDKEMAEMRADHQAEERENARTENLRRIS